MDEARAANKAKDEFLVIVSHELRTPLNGMVAMGQLLARTALSEPQQRMAGIINSSADQLHGVVADVLDTLDINSGKMFLTPELVPAGELIREAAGPACEEAAAKGIGFRLDIAAEAEGMIETDPERLRQVVGKLLDNAVKFTEAGEVSLSAARGEAGGLRIVVRDTGVGFDGATSERLFRPFEQADGSLTRRFGGVGLGLAICRGLVELMGGAIAAEGRPGEGACFTVDLPLAAAAAKAA
jgi:signal transduction histidine kinase